MNVTLPAVVAVGGVTLAGQYLRHARDPQAVFTPGRVVFGTVALGLFLAAVESGSPDVARGLAALIITTAVLVNGRPLFDFLSQKAG